MLLKPLDVNLQSIYRMMHVYVLLSDFRDATMLLGQNKIN